MATPPAPRPHTLRLWLLGALTLLLAAILIPLWIGVPLRRMTGLALHPGQMARASEASPFIDAEAVAAIETEAGYMASCAYTPKSDAQGALNDVRIGERGPDWVAPEASAVGAISLMQAAAFLKSRGRDVSACDRVLDGYFGWVARQKNEISARVYYNAKGKQQRADPATPAAVGMTLVALWKRAEYLNAGQAAAWKQQAWPQAAALGEYLLAHENRQYGLMNGPANSSDLWLTDAVAADDGLRCLSRWASDLKHPDPRYGAAADRLTAGILAMKERGDWGCFYRVREQSQGFRAGYGDSLDQICFLPSEADILPADDAYTKRISDWWTYGGNEFSMTPQTADPADWRYFGLHWHHYFVPRPENDYLYPGPGLQLAKAEWKYASKTGDAEMRARAVRRLRWAAMSRYSDLWRPQDGGGLVDWRGGATQPHTAEDWTRFIDTSGYFVQVTLMVQFGQDTRYVPKAR